MFTVEAQAQAKALIEVYRQEYKARFGALPLMPNEAADRTFLTSLIKQVGATFAGSLIRQYLKMNGEGKEGTWFLDHGHTLGILEKNIASVHATLALTQKQTATVLGFNPVVEFLTRCPKCEVEFNIRCRGADMHKHAYTALCPACDESPQAA